MTSEPHFEESLPAAGAAGDEGPEDGAHVLEECAPAFLDMLDSDPDLAWAAFHDFAWRLLRVHPPPVFRDLPEAVREDLIADLVLRCRDDGFRILRRYRNRGLPFACWLARLARNRAIDLCRREGRRAPEIPGWTHPEPVERIDHRDLLEAVDACLAEMSPERILLLEYAAGGLKPRHIVALLGLPPASGKKVSDKIRECRRELRRRLEQRGCRLVLTTDAPGWTAVRNVIGEAVEG